MGGDDVGVLSDVVAIMRGFLTSTDAIMGGDDVGVLSDVVVVKCADAPWFPFFGVRGYVRPGH